MYKRTLPFLWAVAAAFGLSYCEGLAEPNHGGSHPHPKAHPPGKKGGRPDAKPHTPGFSNGHAKAKPFKPDNAGGQANSTGNNSGNKPQHLTFPQSGTEHAANQQHKDSTSLSHAEWKKAKELHAKHQKEKEQKLQQEIAQRAKLEQDIARLAHLLHEEHHHHHHHDWMNPFGVNPQQQGQQHAFSRQQPGQQQASSSQQPGQQRPSWQQNGGEQASSQGQNGSSADQGPNPSQVAQGQESATNESNPHLASEAFQKAENLVLAAIHQVEQAFAERGEHRHHHLQEAQHLMDDAMHRMAIAAQMMRTYEHPRMDVPPEHRRA